MLFFTIICALKNVILIEIHERCSVLLVDLLDFSGVTFNNKWKVSKSLHA